MAKESRKLTEEQKKFRKRARFHGRRAALWIVQRGMFNAAYHAREAASSAFKAHPELREPEAK